MTTFSSLSRRSVLALAAGVSAVSLAPATAFAQAAPRAEARFDIEELMQPGPLPEMVKGDENAPVTIIEYADMTCSACASFHTNTYPALEEQYISTGKVRFIVRELPRNPRSSAAFMLARCAPNDNHFAMMDALFQQQATWAFGQDARTPLENIAKLAGFTQESFEACLTDQELLNKVNAVSDRGSREFGVRATPTFFINGSRYTGAMTIEQLSSIIDPLLG